MLKNFFFTLVKDYGNIGLTVGLILEFIGIPVPSETLMSLIGFMTRKAIGASIMLPILFAMTGTLIGSTFAYLISFKYGEGLVLKYGKYVFITKAKLDKGNTLINKYTIVFLLFSRFIPGVRHIGPYLSGISRIKRSKFLTFNFIGSLIWTSTFISLGYFVGEKWHRIEKIGIMNILIATILIVFIILVIKLFKKHKFTIFAITFPVLIFIKLSEDVIREELSVFDKNISSFLSNYISTNLKFMMQFLSLCAYTPVLIVMTVLIYFLFRHHEKYCKYWLIIGINLIISDLVVEIFKIIFHRDRPDIMRLVEVSGYSFPSGHSMVGMSFYGLIFYLFFINLNNYKRYLSAILFSLLIFFIGVSRVYLGVHYASDVIAGFSAGLAWLVIYISFIKRSNYFDIFYKKFMS